MKVVRKSTIILSHIFLCLGAILMLYPFVFALLGMFKTIEGFYEVNFLPVPDGIRYGFENRGIKGQFQIQKSRILRHHVHDDDSGDCAAHSAVS